MNKESTLYVVLFSLVVTFLFVLPLTVANELTKAKVEENKKVSQALSILKALNLPADATNPKAVIDSYGALEKFKLEANKLVPVTNEAVESAQKSGFPIQPLFYRGKAADATIWGGAFTGPGLWGNITIALGFDEKIDRLIGYQPIAQVETPGLGARISEAWFIKQFYGQKIPQSGTIRFVNGSGAGDPDMENDSLDGVTGATITTNGVKDIVNKAIGEMKELTQGGVQ